MLKLHTKLITLFPKEEDSALKAKYLTTLQLLNLGQPELLVSCFVRNEAVFNLFCNSHSIL